MYHPDPLWETRYNHLHRSKRHKCFSCGCVVMDGEWVVMHRARRGTRVVHAKCAGQIDVSEHISITHEGIHALGVKALTAAGFNDREINNLH